MFKNFVNAISNIAELDEEQKEKDLQNYLSALESENEINSDADSDSESYDSETEEQEKNTLKKLFFIQNECVDIFICGPPCSGKTELIHCLQKKLGGRIISKPNMTHVECRGNDSSELIKTYNLFEKFQDNPKEYGVAYATHEMLERITESKSTINLLNSKNTKYSFFENSPLETISIILEYAINHGQLDHVNYTIAKNMLRNLYFTAIKEGIFSRFKMFIFIQGDNDICKQRIKAKREKYQQYVDKTQTSPSNLTTNSNPYTTDSMNRLLNQTRLVTQEQKEYDSTQINPNFLEKIIHLHNNLASRKDEKTRVSFGYKTQDSRTVTVNFPQTLDSESKDYHEKIDIVANEIRKQILKRIQSRFQNEFSKQEQEIIIRNTKRKYSNENLEIQKNNPQIKNDINQAQEYVVTADPNAPNIAIGTKTIVNLNVKNGQYNDTAKED